MQDLKKSVQKFLSEHKPYDEPLTIKRLEEIIFGQGYEIIYFDALNMSPKVKYLVDRLELYNACQSREGFTYCQEDIKLVFIKQTLSAKDKQSALLHEEIHIYLDHPFRKGLRETSICQENELHNFIYLMNQKIKHRQIRERMRVIVPLALACLLIVILAFRIHPSNSPKHLIGETIFTTVQTELLSPETSEADTSDPDTSKADTLEPDTTQKPDTTNTQEITSGPPEPVSEPAPVTVYVPVYETQPAPEPSAYTYYWTKSGTVYHIYYDCQHLKNSVSVQSGSKSLSGKDRCCKTCYARYLKATYGNGIE